MSRILPGLAAALCTLATGCATLAAPEGVQAEEAATAVTESTVMPSENAEAAAEPAMPAPPVLPELPQPDEYVALPEPEPQIETAAEDVSAETAAESAAAEPPVLSALPQPDEYVALPEPEPQIEVSAEEMSAEKAAEAAVEPPVLPALPQPDEYVALPEPEPQIEVSEEEVSAETAAEAAAVEPPVLPELPQPDEYTALPEAEPQREAEFAAGNSEHGEAGVLPSQPETPQAADDAVHNADAAPQAASVCTPYANVAMDEHDYRRLESALAAWPHTVAAGEIRRAGQTAAAKAQRTFRVLIPTEGAAAAKLADLRHRGFHGELYDGEISLGTYRSRSAAQVGIARLTSSGFGGGRIQWEEGGIKVSPPEAVGLALTFSGVSAQDMADIRQLIGRSGEMTVHHCPDE